MKTIKKHILLCLIILAVFANNTIMAQSPTSQKQLSKKYSGTWYCKAEKRYIRFYFEKGDNYVTVNDWTGNINKLQNIDVYKAYIKGNKLTLPAENDDHHSSYGEIEIENNILQYKYNDGLNFTDNFLNKKEGIIIIKFLRIKE
nr:hypothetical protein [Flavobacterium sp. ASV13]